MPAESVIVGMLSARLRCRARLKNEYNEIIRENAMSTFVAENEDFGVKKPSVTSDTKTVEDLKGNSLQSASATAAE